MTKEKVEKKVPRPEPIDRELVRKKAVEVVKAYKTKLEQRDKLNLELTQLEGAHMALQEILKKEKKEEKE